MRRFSRRIFIDLPTPKDAFILLIKKLGVDIELNQEQVIQFSNSVFTLTFDIDGPYNYTAQQLFGLGCFQFGQNDKKLPDGRIDQVENVPYSR